MAKEKDARYWQTRASRRAIQVKPFSELEHEECARDCVEKTKDDCESGFCHRKHSDIGWEVWSRNQPLMFCCQRNESMNHLRLFKKDLVVWKGKFCPHEAKSSKLEPKTGIRCGRFLWRVVELVFVARLFVWGQIRFWNFSTIHYGKILLSFLRLKKAIVCKFSFIF